MKIRLTAKSERFDFAKKVAGIVAFAFLMGIREEFSSILLRAFLAGLAFSILALVLITFKSKKQQ